MRFPLSGEVSGVPDTRVDGDILRLTKRSSAWLWVFTEPVNSQGLAGFFFCLDQSNSWPAPGCPYDPSRKEAAPCQAQVGIGQSQPHRTQPPGRETCMSHSGRCVDLELAPLQDGPLTIEHGAGFPATSLESKCADSQPCHFSKLWIARAMLEKIACPKISLSL